MKREDLVELHYITPIANVPSILMRGILSNRRAAAIEHASVAMAEIQDIRAGKGVPQGRPLHDHANLYLCARNPMLYKRLMRHAELTVLRVDPRVLDLPGVVVTDSNAASPYARFAAAPQGLGIVDRELTFADDWTDPDRIQYFRKKSKKCAEVLVPDRVPPEYVVGAHVSCAEALGAYEALATGLEAAINRHLFFR